MIILRQKSFGAISRMKDQYKYSFSEYTDPKKKKTWEYYVSELNQDNPTNIIKPKTQEDFNKLITLRKKEAKKVQFKLKNPKLGAIKDVIENKSWKKY